MVRTSPALGLEAEPVLLNDSLTVYFSDSIQPLSVTADSFTLVDEQGQHVPGALRSGANWITFQPEPPLAADLADGSFRPGATYRLLIAGSPRPDAVRSSDGRWLSAPRSYEVHVADLRYRAPGLSSPLRPLATDLPFLLRTPEVTQLLAADAPRLRLHFTLPVLPTSVSADAFQIRLLRNLEVLRPRSFRVVTSRLDDFPGSTVELDLGSLPRLENGTGSVSLRAGDWVSVELANGAHGLCDYAGNACLPALPQWWSVIAGSSITLAEWSSGDTSFVGDDPVLPTFEARQGSIRPRVRVEAGDGSLGLFRPRRDTTLRPGEPFDRGDGQRVVSRGTAFPFLAIDVPEGVTVVVDATAEPVQLLSCGDIRISGALEIVGSTVPLTRARGNLTPVAQCIGAAPAALVAAGDVRVDGAVRARAVVPADASPLTLACAGRVHLHGQLPFHTILAVEPPPMEQTERAIDGALGQALVVPATFTYGLAPGADFWVRGFTSWRQLPPDRDGGLVRLLDADPGLRASWQSAPADPGRKGEPDLRPGRLGRAQAVMDQDAVSVGASGFVRFELEARVVAGVPVPRLSDLRLVDR